MICMYVCMFMYVCMYVCVGDSDLCRWVGQSPAPAQRREDSRRRVHLRHARRYHEKVRPEIRLTNSLVCMYVCMYVCDYALYFLLQSAVYVRFVPRAWSTMPFFQQMNELEGSICMYMYVCMYSMYVCMDGWMVCKHVSICMYSMYVCMYY